MKTWRKVLVIITTMALLTAMLPVAHALVLDQGTWGENLKWSLDENLVLTISGKGPMAAFDYIDVNGIGHANTPWRAYSSSVKRILIEDGVTTIEMGAFEYFYNLLSVTIPNTVTAIKDGGFYACRSLVALNLPNSLTSIGGGAFVLCENVTSLTIPEGVKVIPNSAFVNAGIKQLKIPSTVTCVEDYAFYGCNNLESLILPETIEKIGCCAFAECKRLKNVDIPDSVKIIGEQVFEPDVIVNYAGSKEEWNEIYFSELTEEGARKPQGKYAPKMLNFGRARKLDSAEVINAMAHFQKMNTYTPGQFSDVTTGDWFAGGVQSAFELGLMKGSSASVFNPKGNLTVGEALAIACRLHSIYAANKQEFVQGDPWYQVYVDYAVDNNIMAVGQLDPLAQITREQFAYLMCGAMPEDALGAINEVTSIPDVAANSSYGGFVYRLYNAGVLTGSDKYGTFKPSTAIQRSEVATIVTRMADKSKRKTVSLEKIPIVATEIQLAGKTQITVGEKVTWTAKALPEGALTAISWAAGNPGVATVDQKGNIIGIKAGQCHITASTSNGIKKTVTVTVSALAGAGAGSTGVSNSALNAEQIYKRCTPAVFYIEVYNAAGKATASGSGFFIDSNGTAVTNYHVIEGASTAKIMRADNKTWYNVAGVYDYSKANDWAVLKIEGSGFPYLPKGDASTVVGGAPVFAIGSPKGLENTISEGIISNPSRRMDGVEYIQTSAPISHGSSGGALINKYGQVIGITSAGIDEAENIGFALPITVVNGYKSSTLSKLGTQSSTSAVTPVTGPTVFNFPFYLYSNDGRVYLGKLVTNKYDSESIWNEYGTYGSRFSMKSIWNEYGTYGGKYSNQSVFNKYATNPPKIIDRKGNFIGYLTANKSLPYGYAVEFIHRFLLENRQ